MGMSRHVYLFVDETGRAYPADIEETARAVWRSVQDQSSMLNSRCAWWIGRSAGDVNRLGFADIFQHRARDCSIHPQSRRAHISIGGTNRSELGERAAQRRA